MDFPRQVMTFPDPLVVLMSKSSFPLFLTLWIRVTSGLSQGGFQGWGLNGPLLDNCKCDMPWCTHPTQKVFKSADVGVRSPLKLGPIGCTCGLVPPLPLVRLAPLYTLLLPQALSRQFSGEDMGKLDCAAAAMHLWDQLQVCGPWLCPHVPQQGICCCHRLLRDPTAWGTPEETASVACVLWKAWDRPRGHLTADGHLPTTGA